MKNVDILVQKADSITRLQRPYIKKILRNLASSNEVNANLICEYIINEEAQFNIKESTKEGKIKILVWISANFLHTKSFKEITKDYDVTVTIFVFLGGKRNKSKSINSKL